MTRERKVGLMVVTLAVLVCGTSLVLRLRRVASTAAAPLADGKLLDASQPGPQDAVPRLLQESREENINRTMVAPATLHVPSDNANPIPDPKLSPADLTPFEPNPDPLPVTPSSIFTDPLSQPQEPEIPVEASEQEISAPAETAVNIEAAFPVATPPSAEPVSIRAGENDSFWLISERIYGTGSYYRALYEHNRRLIAAPDRLQPGELIETPPLETLCRLYPELCPRDSAQSQPAVPPRVYVVKPGETLTDIARYELGRGSRWVEIYRLNRDQLGFDLGQLPPGMKLMLPGDAENLSSRPQPAPR